MVLVEVYGANYAKANWANWAKGKLGKLLFSMCTGNVTNYKYNIYNNKYNIYILYLLLTWKSRCAYMKMPNLLLPNLPTNSGLSSTRQ